MGHIARLVERRPPNWLTAQYTSYKRRKTSLKYFVINSKTFEN